MQKHLLNERFTLVIDGLIGVPRRVQVHEIQLYLRLQAHDVRRDQSSAKDVLQNRTKWPRLLLRVGQDTACVVVTLTEVGHLTREPLPHSIVSGPDALTLL